MTKAEAKKNIQGSFTLQQPVKDVLLDLIDRTHREAPRAKKKKAPAKSKAAPAV